MEVALCKDLCITQRRMLPSSTPPWQGEAQNLTRYLNSKTSNASQVLHNLPCLWSSFQSLTGVVANMVQHFNLRTAYSVSQISSSPTISSPVDVRHTAGQKPGGPVLQRMLASADTLSQDVAQALPAPGGLYVSLSASELSPLPSNSNPEEKRFSGSGI